MREDWIEVELGNVCFTTSGGTPKRSNKEFYGGDIAWIKSGELNYSYIRSAEEYITDLALQKSSAKLFPKGTILIALYGATIGKLAILDIEASTNQAICGIHSSSFLETKFLFHYLLCKQRFLIGLGTGGAQPNISQTILKKLLVNLPPLPEQRAIVAKIEELFSSLDNGIANIEKAQEQLKVYRQAVLKKAFEGELTKEWREKQTDLPSAEELLEQIKVEREKYYEQQVAEWKVKVVEWAENGKKGKKPGKPKKLPPSIDVDNDFFKVSEIPSSWIWTPLLNIGYWNGGGTPSKGNRHFWTNGDILWISPKDMKSKYIESSIDKITNEAVLNSSAKYIPENSILFVVRSGILRRILPIAITKLQSTVNQDIQAFTPVKIISEYIYYYCLSEEYMIRHKCAKAGTTVESVESFYLKQLPVPLSSLEEQSQIIQEIESRLSVCDKVEESITEGLQKAKALKQSILKKAFDGALLTEVELEACKKEADWEPAEVLLERIKAEKATETTKRKLVKKKK